AVLAKPAQAGIGRGPAIFVLFQASDCAVVNHLSLFIAPAAVDHLTRLHLINVARDHAVYQPGGVFARDQILIQRRNIDQRGSIADGVVLVLVMHLIGADCVIARPLAVVQALAQGKSAIVKCSTNGQGKTSKEEIADEDYSGKKRTSDGAMEMSSTLRIATVF